MKRTYSYFLLFLLFILGACRDEPIDVEDTVITQFSFLMENNSGLAYSVDFNISTTKISGTLPPGTDLSNLVATFNHNGLKVTVNNVEQVSGQSANNFNETVVYTVTSANGLSINYTIDIWPDAGLPVVYITTTNGVYISSKEETVDGFVLMYGGLDYPDLPKTEMVIRGRGNSTWGVHPKKPYQLKFTDKTEVLGMPDDRKWIFLAEYSDKTIIRNKITFEMGHISQLEWTPQSVYAEVYVNNNYNGVYLITQKVEESKNRLDIGDEGYLMELDTRDHIIATDVYFNTNDFLIKIKEPELEWNNPQYNLIKSHISEFENVLHSDIFADSIDGYAKYIDINSFVDWYLINEIVKNQDSKDYSSMFLTYIPGEKIKMGPLWDFDLSFGNVDYSVCEYPTGFWVKEHKWFHRLFQDETFVALVKERFLFFRENQDYILEKIDFYANYLGEAQNKNNGKWQTIGKYVWPNPVVFNSYQEEVIHLKNWYSTRMDWLENAYANL